MVESALDSETHVRGFADRLGERFIVPQPSGSLLEHLQLRRDLAAAPFFEPAVKERLARLANFRHASYTRVRRLRTGERGVMVLVSTHVPGRRLSEVLQIASRSGFRPPTAAVLWLTRQLLTSVALLHDYGPDIFHGAIGPDRVILAGEGRVVLAEYVLGTAVEQAVGPWGVHHLWRELRVPTLADFDLPGYGRRLDLLQVGLVTLSFLLGRPLAAAEFPEGLRHAVDEATEAGADGAAVPLREDLRSWIRRMVCSDHEDAFRSLVEGQKALAQLLQDGATHPASSTALQAFVEQCESAPWYHSPEPDSRPAAGETTDGAAGALVDTFKPPEPPRPSAADLVGSAPAPDVPEAATATPSDSDWAPTPEPLVVRTLFEALTPAPPPPPPAPTPESAPSLEFWPSASSRAARDAEKTGERQPDRAAAADVAAEAAANRVQTYQQPEAALEEPWRTSTAPAAVAPPRGGRRTSSTRLIGRRRSPFSPARIGIAVGALVAIVLLALAVPRFWGSGSGPAEGRLVVESEPTGAEVTIDGREAGTTPLSVKVAPGAHKLEVGIGGSSRSVWINVPEGGTQTESVTLSEAMQLSGLRVDTDPPEGTVSVNGTTRGKAPVRVSELQPGLQSLVVEGPFGPVESEVRVAAGERAKVLVATAGWVRVSSPFALEVRERGRVYGNTADGRVMVPVGRHHFDLVNDSLGVNVRQFVNVPAGVTVQVPFDPRHGMLNVDADQTAEVWLDGRLLGHTPLVSVEVPLGSHEVVFRHPKLGDLSYTVMVTLKAPVRLSAVFTKK